MMRRSFVIAFGLLTSASLPAAELSGQLEFNSHDGKPFCVSLDRSVSPELSEYCFASIRLSWQLNTVAETPLLRYSATLTPLTTGYTVNAVSLDMSAYVFPGIGVAPSDPVGSNIGLAVPLDSVLIRRAGDPAGLSTPAAHDWDALFVDVGGRAPCTPNTNNGSPVFVPEYVARSLVSEGLSFGMLTVCNIEIAGIQANVRDEGLSLDDLLADTIEVPGTQPAQVPDDDFEAMLSGLEDEIQQGRAQTAYEQALAEEQARAERCNAEAAQADGAFNELIAFITTPGEMDELHNVGNGGDCSGIVEDMYARIDEVSGNLDIMINGNTVYGQLHPYYEGLEQCASEVREALEDFNDEIAAVDVGGCEFNGGHPLDGVSELRTQVEDEVDYLREQAEVAEEADRQLMSAAEARVGASNAAWLDSMFPNRDESVLEMTARIDQRNELRRQREAAVRARAQRASQPPARSGLTLTHIMQDMSGNAPQPTTSERQPGSQTNEKLVIDNGESCLDKFTEVDDLNRCYMESLDAPSGSDDDEASTTRSKTQ